METLFNVLREPIKKIKVWKIPHLGGDPDQVIFHTFEK